MAFMPYEIVRDGFIQLGLTVGAVVLVAVAVLVVLAVLWRRRRRRDDQR